MCVTSTVYAQADLGRAGAGRRSRAGHDRDERRSRHRRPDPRRSIGPRGDDRRRRTAHRARVHAARLLARAGSDRRDRGGRQSRAADSATGERRASTSTYRHRYTPQVVSAPVRPGGRRGAGGRGHRAVVAVLPRPVAGRSAQARLRRRAATGRRGRPAVARAASRTPNRAPRLLMPPLVWNLAPDDAARDPDDGGHVDPLRAGGAATADRGHRRDAPRCPAPTSGRCPANPRQPERTFNDGVSRRSSAASPAGCGG